MGCRHCGAEVEGERVALGYDYCTRDDCVEACFEPVDVIAVAVNKASDQYLLKRDLEWSEPHPREPVRDDGGWLPRPRSTPERAAPRGSAARIAELEAQLDADLANEADPARRAKLVNDFNARLRRLNIRYHRTAQRRP